MDLTLARDSRSASGLGADTIPHAFFGMAAEKRNSLVFRKRCSRELVEFTWSEVQARVLHLAVALVRRDLAPGDRVGVIADNGPDWAVADLAIQSAGGVVVPLYSTSSREQIAHILADAGVAFCFAGSPRYLERVLACREDLDPGPDIALLADAATKAPPAASGVYSSSAFLGETPSSRELRDLEARWQALTPDDLSSIIFTSGTTGLPKGVCLSHGNILTNIEGGLRLYQISPDDLMLSILPMSHSFERTMGFYAPLICGAPIHFARSAGTLAKDMLEARPTVAMVVPRFLEKVRQKIEVAFAERQGLSGRISRLALDLRLSATRSRIEGRELSTLRRWAASLALGVIGKKVRERLGGQVRLLIAGGAALSQEVWIFFEAIGIHVLEGYGLTECAPVISCNPPGAVKPGSVGTPLDNLEIKIADDGEILVKGPCVMQGYHNKPDDTALVINREGFLHTGDVGHLDSDGYLYITDRKKDIIVNKAGKNISPQFVENKLTSSPLIDFACVLGDGENYLTAILSPDLESLKSHVKRDGALSMGNDLDLTEPEIVGLFQGAIDRVNASLAPYERVFRFHVVPRPFSIDGGEITSTLKVRRRFIQQKYAGTIALLFKSKAR